MTSMPHPRMTDPFVARLQGVTAHGNIPFDVPFISHIEDNLYQGGCATGLELPPVIQHVVSLYPWEQYTIRHQPKSVSLHWMYDSVNGDPSIIVYDIADWVVACMADGPTLVHCQAGLNRSSLIAALALTTWKRSMSATIDLLREKRSTAVLCNPVFERWLRGAA